MATRDHGIEASELEVTVASGQPNSESIDLGGFAGAIVEMPSALTSTATTFQVSLDESNWVALYDSSNVQVSMTIAVDRAYDLPSELFAARYFRFVFGSNEGADRTLRIHRKS